MKTMTERFEEFFKMVVEPAIKNGNQGVSADYKESCKLIFMSGAFSFHAAEDEIANEADKDMNMASVMKGAARINDLRAEVISYHTDRIKAKHGGLMQRAANAGNN